MNEKRKVCCLSKCKNCTVHVADECKMVSRAWIAISQPRSMVNCCLLIDRRAENQRVWKIYF